MPNRTTVKNNIQVINVPTVSNADMNTMLQTNICDNVVFKEDVAVAQASAVTAINCDFTGKDRINLTRTGGALQITVAGIVDGDRVFLLITKTAGQPVTFVGVTDITPVAANVTAVTTVLYEIIRKGSNYFASAIIKSPLYATDTVEGILRIGTVAENNALSSTTVVVTPGRIPIASTSQEGVVEIATPAEVDAGTDVDGTGDQLVVEPSQLIRKLAELQTDHQAWQNIALSTNWTSAEYCQYFKDNSGNTHVRMKALVPAAITPIGTTVLAVGSLPPGYLPGGGVVVPFTAVVKTADSINNVVGINIGFIHSSGSISIGVNLAALWVGARYIDAYVVFSSH